MSKLESIKKLAQEYKPRIEEIFEKEMGDVTVREYSTSQVLQGYIDDCKEKGTPLNWLEKLRLKKQIKNRKNSTVMETVKDTVYANLKHLRTLKQEYPEIEKRGIVHELAHILDNDNNLRDAIQDSQIWLYTGEGFAEYVAHEFPEIYQNEKVINCIKKKYKKEALQDHFIKGYEFFKKVGEAIGRENIIQVFENPPQSIEEILQPESYLQRIEGGGKWEEEQVNV